MMMVHRATPLSIHSNKLDRMSIARGRDEHLISWNAWSHGVASRTAARDPTYPSRASLAAGRSSWETRRRFVSRTLIS